MVTKKLLFFFVFIIPLACPRHASTWNKNIFSNDNVVGRHRSHSIQHEKASKTQGKIISENKTNTEDDKPRIMQGVNNMEIEGARPLYKVCKTLGCKNLAIEFRRSLNISVDPCENFYGFACSGWESTKPLPDNIRVWNRFAMQLDITTRRIKAILESEPDSGDILPVRQAKQWYSSCMNIETQEQNDLKSIASIMTQSGGWPMAMNEREWNENEYNWRRVENYYANLTGSYVFYDIGIENPQETSAMGRINIVPPNIPLDKQFFGWFQYDNDDSYSQYLSLVMDVVRSFADYNQVSVSNERLIKETTEMLLFAKEVFKLSIPDESKDYFKHTSFQNLSNWYNSNGARSKIGNRETNIDWSSMIQGLFNIVNIKVHPSTDVYVRHGKYIEGIGELLQRTPSRTIVNYIHWYFLGQMPYLGIRLNFKTTKISSEPRWMGCLDKINMKYAISYIYLKKYFTRRFGTAAQELVENVRTAMRENMDGSNWLDPESKALMKDKLNSMELLVGFPKWFDNKTAIIDYYKDLIIGNNSFDNGVSYMRYERQQYLKQYITLKSQFDPDKLDSPITGSAWYDIKKNFAQFPAKDFLPPFFGLDLPLNVNYGMVARIVGHEIGHGFDTCGITFGKDGNETQLTDTVLKSYYKQATCFVDQFDEYAGNSKVSTGAKRNCPDAVFGDEDTYGQITVTENIADTTGLQGAFQAYKKLSKKNNSNWLKCLPGLEQFTDDQLFFLSFAEMSCEVPTPTDINRQDPHSRADFRVNGAVSNSKNFAKAFKCPIGSRMNPIKKCNIWNKSDDRWIETP